MKFLVLPEKSLSYNARDVLCFVAQTMRVKPEVAAELIPDVGLVQPGDFRVHGTVVAKSLGEIRSFKFILPDQRRVMHSLFPSSGDFVAVFEKNGHEKIVSLNEDIVEPYRGRMEKLRKKLIFDRR